MNRRDALKRGAALLALPMLGCTEVVGVGGQIGTCSTCKYYGPYKLSDGTEIGVCRRYPEFWIKDPDDWCGEYRTRGGK